MAEIKSKSDELAVLRWFALPFLASNFKKEAEIAYLNARQELQWFSQVPKSQPPPVKPQGRGVGIDGKPKHDGVERFEVTTEEWEAIADRVNEKEQKEWEERKEREELARKEKQQGHPDKSSTPVSAQPRASASADAQPQAPASIQNGPPSPSQSPMNTWSNPGPPPFKNGPPEYQPSAVSTPASAPPTPESSGPDEISSHPVNIRMLPLHLRFVPDN